MTRDICEAIEQRKDFSYREYMLQIPECMEGCAGSKSIYHNRIIRCAVLPFVEKMRRHVFLNDTIHVQDENRYYKTKQRKKMKTIRKIVTGSVICFEDISDEREREQREYRNKSFMSMRQITAGIAHEIKNPLGAISLHLQLLHRKITKYSEEKGTKLLQTEDILKYINIIEDEINTMDKVVSVFLNDFKVQKDDLEPKNIHDVLLQMIAFIEPI